MRCVIPRYLVIAAAYLMLSHIKGVAQKTARSSGIFYNLPKIIPWMFMNFLAIWNGF
ncbi:protein of unknown function [Azospirillum baldaniorum]|uniref:Uncharacterized protein n=1 Tax=Azospirillum baldaniorum TaxID=1064539 RepID=A0A9P1NKW4_9PROT|nr:protein of unknown function [Azospirillum baldaniorum]